MQLKAALSGLAPRLPLLKAASLYSVERLAFILVGLVVYSIVARYLGPDRFGILNYVQTIVQFGSPFLAVGCEAILIRELVRRPEEENQILGSAFAIIVFLTIFTVSFPVAYFWLIHPHQPLLAEVAIALSVGYIPNAFLIIEFFFRARMMARTIVVCKLGSLAFGAGLKLILIYYGFSVTAIALATSIEAAVLVALFIVEYRRTGRSVLHWRLSRTQVSRDHLVFMAKQSFPAMISAIMVLLFFRISHLMLANLRSYAEVAQYSVAFQVITMLNMAPTVFFAAIYPRLVALENERPERFRDVCRNLFAGFALLSYVTVAGLYLTSDLIIRVLVGRDFQLAGPVLFVLSASVISTFSGAVRSQIIFIYNLPIYHAINALVGFVVLIPLNFFLIPRYGAVGAAWGVTLSLAVTSIVTSFMFERMRAIGRDQVKGLLLMFKL